MEQTATQGSSFANRAKFLVGGLLIFAAIVYLIISSTQASAQYFHTIEELSAMGSVDPDRELRVSGAVIGDSIKYDPQALRLEFDVVHVPGDNAEIEAEGGLAEALHRAVEDPSRPRLHVIYEEVKPDLLRHEAQAIMTGHMREDGSFYAEELLLKCPTKYEEALPEQSGM